MDLQNRMTPPRADRKHQFPVWRLLLPALALILAACGTGGSGGDTGGGDRTPPSEPETVLATTYQLDGHELGDDTWLRQAYLVRIEDGSGWINYLPAVRIPADGLVDIEYDAADIKESFDAETYFQYYLPSSEDGPAPLEISAPDVQVKATSTMSLMQFDPAGTGRFITSHWLDLRHYFEADHYNSMRAVFAEQSVRIRADYTAGLYRNMIDIELQPGWNLLYYEFDFVDEQRQRKLHARPATGPIAAGGSAAYTWLGNFEADYDADQLTVFTRTHPDSEPTVLDSSYLGTGSFSRYLDVFSWIHPEQVPLGPISEWFGESTSGTITGAEELRVTAAEFLTYPAGVPQTDDALYSNGSVWFSSTVGDHPVIVLYADRSATVRINDLEVPAENMIVQTEFSGLQLAYGWNYVVAVADSPDEGQPVTVTLTTVESDEVKLEAVQH